jgi:hypothetical protein
LRRTRHRENSPTNYHFFLPIVEITFEYRTQIAYKSKVFCASCKYLANSSIEGFDRLIYNENSLEAQSPHHDYIFAMTSTLPAVHGRILDLNSYLQVPISSEISHFIGARDTHVPKNSVSRSKHLLKPQPIPQHNKGF